MPVNFNDTKTQELYKDFNYQATNPFSNQVKNETKLLDTDGSNLSQLQEDKIELSTDKYSADDGKISPKDKLINFGKGIISPVTNIFKSPKNFLVGAGMIVGVTALTVATGGAIAPLLVTLGVVGGGIQLVTSAYKAGSAKTDEAARQAWQGLGAGTTTVVGSVVGAKAAAKGAHIEGAKNMNPLQAIIACIKNTPKAISNSFKSFTSGEFLVNLKLKEKPTTNDENETEKLDNATKNEEVKPENKEAKPKAEQTENSPEQPVENSDNNPLIDNDEQPVQEEVTETQASKEQAPVQDEKTATTDESTDKVDNSAGISRYQKRELAIKKISECEKRVNELSSKNASGTSYEDRLAYHQARKKLIEAKIELNKMDEYEDTAYELEREMKAVNSQIELIKRGIKGRDEIFPQFEKECSSRKTSIEMKELLSSEKYKAYESKKLFPSFSEIVEKARKAEILKPTDKPVKLGEQNLTNAQIDKLRVYEKNSFGSNANCNRKEMVEILDDIFAQVAPIKDDGYVYRTVRAELYGESVFSDSSFEVGKVVHNPGITSTSQADTGAFNYFQLGANISNEDYVMRIHLPKGAKCIEMPSFEYKGEIVLPPNNDMLVTGFNPKTKVVDLEYILPKE